MVVGGGKVALHSRGKTTFNFTYIKKGTFEEVDEDIGRENGICMDFICEVGDRAR